MSVYLQDLRITGKGTVPCPGQVLVDYYGIRTLGDSEIHLIIDGIPHEESPKAVSIRKRIQTAAFDVTLDGLPHNFHAYFSLGDESDQENERRTSKPEDP